MTALGSRIYNQKGIMPIVGKQLEALKAFVLLGWQM